MKGIPMRRLIIVLFALLLSACGFQLRGSYSLPWETIYIDLPESDDLYPQLLRNIEMTTQTKVVNDPKQAKATLAILRNSTNKNILALSAKGRVREFQLTQIFVYAVKDRDGKELLPANQIILQRDLTFDDVQVYAKESEEAVIQREMQRDIVQQLLRRLSVAGRTPDKK
jgi:LPS-assembly lipoprotein